MIQRALSDKVDENDENAIDDEYEDDQDWYDTDGIQAWLPDFQPNAG